MYRNTRIAIRSIEASDLVVQPSWMAVRFRAATFFVFGVLAFSCATLATEDNPQVDLATSAIVNGTPSTRASVYNLLQTATGGSCTAALVSPHVVLTARHCVSLIDPATQEPTQEVVTAAQMLVSVTDNINRGVRRTYAVREIRVPPIQGTFSIGDGQGSDLAVLILQEAASETPFMMAHQSNPSVLLGQTVTAVGFGLTPSGTTGEKLETSATVTEVSGGVITVSPSACQGDSGGPLLGSDGRVWGVVSFGFDPSRTRPPVCGTAVAAYNQLYVHRAWLDTALEEAGDACSPTRSEECNGRDDNCDRVIDEGCSVLGQRCTADTRCTTQQCVSEGDARVCTQSCSDAPNNACPSGFYCAWRGCARRCVEGGNGTMAIDTSCSRDQDCRSKFCANPGDGRKRCLFPCHGDNGECASGEACTAARNACGACVASSLVAPPRGIAEPCANDRECRSGSCRDRAGIRACYDTCVDMTCASGRCVDGICLLTAPAPIGATCLNNGDCVSNTCAAQGQRHWCTQTCSNTVLCGPGTECTNSNGQSLCLPTRALLGETCSNAESCVSGLCASSNGRQVCVSACSGVRDCPAGFLCQRGADGNLCVPPAHGGCQIGAHSVHSVHNSYAVSSVFALLLLAIARRSTRTSL